MTYLFSSLKKKALKTKTDKKKKHRDFWATLAAQQARSTETMPLDADHITSQGADG